MGTVHLLQGERIDEIGFHGLRLIQKPEDFCYGIDAVILADFAARGGMQLHRNRHVRRIMDLGTGTGVIPLIMSHKTDADEIYGLEVQEGSWDRARRNVELNGLSARISVIRGDVSDVCAEEFGSFDAVVSNPPYMPGSCGLINTNEAKNIARHETTAGLEGFVRAAALLLRDRGDFYMVHRPSRLADICCVCREAGLEPKELRFVSPNRDVPPNILLIHCVKGGGRELRLGSPLYVYEANGSYTAEIQEIYER